MGLIHMLGNEAFGDDHQGCAAAVVGFLYPLGDLLDADFLFRDQDGVVACGHAGVQGDPANVAAHDFGDHAAVVRFTGGP
ncbi:hypothetical protein FQZ97_1089190 [compost metagenome]